jgi:CO/xanthine dehydrogenase Mo-binding subunit
MLARIAGLDDSNPLGVKGVGEVGIVGVPAAIANAVYHATGKRIRDLPITLDKLPAYRAASLYLSRSANECKARRVGF